MPEAAEQPAKPRRTWLPMALWSAGILLALGVAWFVGAVVVPVWQVRNILQACSSKGSYSPDGVISGLGGPESTGRPNNVIAGARHGG